MDCKQFLQHIDDYITGELKTSIKHDIENHLDDCVDCQQSINNEKAIRQGLRQLPFEPMRPDFSKQALKHARNVNQTAEKNSSHHWLSGAGAIAASVFLGMVVLSLFNNNSLIKPQQDIAIHQVSMSINEDKSLNLMFDSPEILAQTTFHLEMTDGIRLAGRPDTSSLNWTAKLLPGNNQLPLTLQANQVGEQVLRIRINQGQQEKRFNVQFTVTQPGVTKAQPALRMSSIFNQQRIQTHV